MRLLPCLALLLAGCTVEPRTFAPPPQRRPLGAPVFTQRILVMTDDSVEQRIVKDVAGGHADSWRWTGQHPTLRVRLMAPDTFRYRIEFAVAEATFKQTGPVTITFLVNDKPLGRQTYSKPGSYSWEAPVPDGLLQPNADNTIGASIDKVWVSPADGSRLGFILSTIGLVH